MKPVVDGLQTSYSDKLDFVVYTNLNSEQSVSQFADSQGVVYVPTMMLVNAEGTELTRWVGAVADGELKMAFDEATP